MSASPLLDVSPDDLAVTYSISSAQLGQRPLAKRRLADLRGCFFDTVAFDAAVAAANPLVYEVSAVEPAHGDGQLHYGQGRLMPGRIGAEYYMTKGHYHTARMAAEVYIGLSGDGAMLLEDELTGESRLLPLHSRSVIYVPGKTAHRTVNLGNMPLVYFGVYPANAGHDYGAIAQQNFRMMVVAGATGPRLVERPRMP